MRDHKEEREKEGGGGILSRGVPIKGITFLLGGTVSLFLFFCAEMQVHHCSASPTILSAER